MRIVSYDFDNKNFHLVGFTSVNKKGYRTYSVPSEKADEFVRKYNNQARVLPKFVMASTVACAFACLSKKASFFVNTLKFLSGVVSSFLLSTFISYKLNCRLLNKYDVKEIEH
jgi:hypothetical protein